MKMNRRFVLSGAIAAPAVIVIERLMPVRSIVKPYATVWGIGWDLEVIKHDLWEPISVAGFGNGPNFDKFREVTEWEWGFELELARGFEWPTMQIETPLERFKEPSSKIRLWSEIAPNDDWKKRAEQDDLIESKFDSLDDWDKFRVSKKSQACFDALHNLEVKHGNVIKYTDKAIEDLRAAKKLLITGPEGEWVFNIAFPGIRPTSLYGV